MAINNVARRVLLALSHGPTPAVPYTAVRESAVAWNLPETRTHVREKLRRIARSRIGLC
jgi:hypothetical protein